MANVIKRFSAAAGQLFGRGKKRQPAIKRFASTRSKGGGRAGGRRKG